MFRVELFRVELFALLTRENFLASRARARIKIAMNTTGRKTVKAKATAAKSVKATGTSMAAALSPPSYDSIAKRSYEIYLERGAQPGHEVEDWLAAEAELTAKL
jgi:hypothetical protein